MTIARKEEKSLDKNTEENKIKEPLESQTNSSTNPFIRSARKLKFNRLWVRKKNADASIISEPQDSNCCSLAKLGLKENSQLASTSLKETTERSEIEETVELKNEKEEIEKTYNKAVGVEFTVKSCDASIETSKIVGINVGVGRHCDTVSTASGSDTLIKISCVNQENLSREENNTADLKLRRKYENRKQEKRADDSSTVEGTSYSITSATSTSLEDFLDNVEFIDDCPKKCFPYPIKLITRLKPNHVEKHSSTDKSRAPQRLTTTIGVGSSIVINVPEKTTVINIEENSLSKRPKIRKSITIRNHHEKSGPKIRHQSQNTSESNFSKDSTSHRNHHNKRERKTRRTKHSSFLSKSEDSSKLTDDDFTLFKTIVESDDQEKSAKVKGRSRNNKESSFTEESNSDGNHHHDNRERKTRKTRNSSFLSEFEDSSNRLTDDDFTLLDTIVESDDQEKYNQRSVNRSDDTYESNSRRSSEKSRWMSPNESRNRSWLDDASDDCHEKLRRRSFQESTRLSLRSIENSWRTLLPLVHRDTRGIDLSDKTELSASSREPKIRDRVTEPEIHARGSDEIMLRRYEPRSRQLFKTRLPETSIKKGQTHDKNDSFLELRREGPFTFNLRKLSKSRNCKLFEFNDLDKSYETNRFRGGIVCGSLKNGIFGKEKSCKCGNGCGIDLQNKRCLCHH